MKDVKYYGSEEEVDKTGSRPANVRSGPASITILPSAIRSFKFHHGGTDREAEIQIRKMLVDFLDKSARTVTTANYLVLSRDGYRLDIGPNRRSITAYRSAHRDRTWEQVKIGIPSRINSAQAEPMPLLPTLQAPAPRPAPPERPTPLTLARTEPEVSDLAELSDVIGGGRTVQHSAAGAGPDSTELRSTCPEPSEFKPASTPSGDDNTQHETLETVVAAASLPPARPIFADTPSAAKQRYARHGINEGSGPSGRRISLSAAAAIALGALLIGRRTGRRR